MKKINSKIHLPIFAEFIKIFRITLIIFLFVQLFGCMPDNNNDSEDLKNMVQTAQLGIGFDAVHVDPEDLTKNSVQGIGFTRPKVFKFKPDRNFIQLAGLNDNQTEIKNLPYGVSGDNKTKFQWSNETNWTSTASEFQKDFSHSYSGSVGLPGIASVSASASFKNVSKNTRNGENMYANQYGSFHGHSLAINLNYPHELTEEFKSVVNSLGNEITEINYLIPYEEFISNWGTHFSRDVMMGAKCTYRFKLSKSAFQRSKEDMVGFKAEVSGAIKALKVGFGANMESSTAKSVGIEIGATEADFISFGGSGINDFGVWSTHAINNRSLIDVKLESYLSLLNRNYFPDDPNIGKKYRNLQEVFKLYFEKNGHRDITDPNAFFTSANRKYEIKVKEIHLRESSDNHGHYFGYLYAGFWTTDNETKGYESVFRLGNNEYQRWELGHRKIINKSIEIIIPAKEANSVFAMVHGEMKEYDMQNGRNESVSMGSKTIYTIQDSEKVELSKVSKEKMQPGKVVFIHPEFGDVLEVYYEVRQLPL